MIITYTYLTIPDWLSVWCIAFFVDFGHIQ